jgi:hypothetical protein
LILSKNIGLLEIRYLSVNSFLLKDIIINFHVNLN